MAGSIIVKYAQKTFKQQRAELINSETFENKNYSVDIIPESMSIMTFETWKEARKFAQYINETGHHILEMRDDYRGKKKK
jgi:hypothetical protein